MAKIDIFDFRTSLVDEIGRTDNLKVLKSITRSIEKMTFTSDLTQEDLNRFMYDGLMKLKSLVSEDSYVYFQPLQEGFTLSTASDFFEKNRKVMREKEEQGENLAKFETKRSMIMDNITRNKKKFRYAKVADWENRLFALDSPVESSLRVEQRRETLRTSLSMKQITEEEYIKKLGVLSKLERISRDSLSWTSTVSKSAEKNANGKTNAQEIDESNQALREYLLYMFFSQTDAASKKAYSFLFNYYGDVCIDFEHMLLLYNYLKTIKYAKLQDIEAALYFVGLQQLYVDLYPLVSKTAKREISPVILKNGPYEFDTLTYPAYNRGFFPYYMRPLERYTSYIFEPKNLAQQAFMTAVDIHDLSTIPKKYDEVRRKLKHSNTGIFYEFLSKDLENRLLPTMLNSDFPLSEMDGTYSELLCEEFKKRVELFSGLPGFHTLINPYQRIVKPYSLEIMGTYVRTYCEKLFSLRDKKMAYIYYVSPQRLAIAVRDDVTDEMLHEIFDAQFISALIPVKKPRLRSIIFGEFL